MSRVWRKVKADWEAGNARSLAEEPIVRLILDGTVVRVRLDRKATSISLLVVIGVREDGQKVLLALKNMGGETTEAWRAVLDDLVSRGLRHPAFLIVDGEQVAAASSPVADCLEEAGDRLFTFTRLPPSQWRSARTTNAMRRIKTQTVLARRGGAWQSPRRLKSGPAAQRAPAARQPRPTAAQGRPRPSPCP